MVANSIKTRAHSSHHATVQMRIGQNPLGQIQRSITPLQWDVGTVAAKSLLDRVEALLREQDSVDEAMVELMSGLWSLRSSATPEVWRSVIDQCMDHPIRELIHQDPFSARSFHKPRGYSGDAVLIDYIYTRDCRISEENTVSSLGEKIFGFNRDTPACAAVRARRDLIAAVIDQVCVTNDRPSMLSVGCGHLREASLCRSVRSGNTGRFIALDQDEQSLSIVARDMSDHGVVPVCNSIKSLFRGDIARERFDLIYSTGLYDYLDDRIATKLTERMFDMLNPGGRMLIANFLPDIWGCAYMESFMDWKLIYRTPEQFGALTDSLPDSEVASARTFIEKHANIVFLEVIRA
jgi:extracellular factor (EF) 3-hydroxypalmitic acid methyl ester biosynthesis protein